MYRLLRLFRTSVGSKLTMAVSGLALALFLAGHLAGNLKVFQGQAALNEYAAWLQGHPLLWIMRTGLLAIFVPHLVTGIRLAVENRAARPRRYRVQAHVRTSLAARTMVLSGGTILAFVIFHLLHLTLGLIEHGHWHLVDAVGRPDVYSRLVLGFMNPWVAGAYGLAVLVLGLHLQHAIRGLFQTLGFSHESYHGILDRITTTLSLALTAGFLSIPLAVRLGMIPLPPGVRA